MMAEKLDFFRVVTLTRLNLAILVQVFSFSKNGGYMVKSKQTEFCLHDSQNSWLIVGKRMPLLAIRIWDLGKHLLVAVMKSLIFGCNSGSPPISLIIFMFEINRLSCRTSFVNSFMFVYSLSAILEKWVHPFVWDCSDPPNAFLRKEGSALIEESFLFDFHIYSVSSRLSLQSIYVFYQVFLIWENLATLFIKVWSLGFRILRQPFKLIFLQNRLSGAEDNRWGYLHDNLSERTLLIAFTTNDIPFINNFKCLTTWEMMDEQSWEYCQGFD